MSEMPVETRPNVREDAISVCVLDPAPLARICVVAGLESDAGLVSRGCGAIEEVGDGAAPDVLLIHAGSGEDMGWLVDSLHRAAFDYPDTALMILVDEVTHAAVEVCQSDKVAGALTSATSIGALTRAIRLAHEGVKVFSPTLLTRRAAPVGGLRAAEPGLFPDDMVPRRSLALTPRQEEVVRLLANGCSNREIASRLRVSESTVKVHVRTLMSGIGASNRTQIVAHLLTGRFPGESPDGTA